MDKTSVIVTFVIFFIVLAGVLALIISVSVINAKYRNFVLSNSEAIQNLNNLNKQYHFMKNGNFDMTNTYDNENFYEDISPQDYLTYELVYKQKVVSKALKDTLSNKELNAIYKQQVSEITTFGHFISDIGKLKEKKLIRFEQDEFEKKVLEPQTSFTIYVKLRLERINGRYRDSKATRFSAETIKGIINKLNQKQGKFYTNRDIWDAICRVERGKVSNKMRFAIYARDNYRCCICGRKTNDLEIDHIYPIAKGGKTTRDNLQTLCHRCNVRKGDSV